MKKVIFALLVILSMNLCYSATTDDMYPFTSATQQAQFQHLLTELRCLVCQNQNLADSNAGLANDLKLQVYKQVIDGRSDSQIVDYMTQRYGDFVLFKPPVKAITIILWLAPAGFLLLGFIALILKFKKSQEADND